MGLERGTREYRRLGLAMWCTGLATFVLVYAVQGLLPTLAQEFGVSSGTSSLALSATTLGLALAVVPLSAVAESWGRIRVMTVALASAVVLCLLAPLAPTFAVLVAIRGLTGVALAALPALAMAHMTREVAPRYLGGAVGLLIAGNGIGGLCGRLIASGVADLAGWRAALLVVGLVSLGCTVVFRLLLPAAQAPPAEPVRLRDLGGPVLRHLRDRRLLGLFGIAFLLMSTFVTMYNYLGFRLLRPPFGLPAAVVALIFLGYVAGSYTSTVAGRLADRLGRVRVLAVGVGVAAAGAWIALPGWLPSVLLGLIVLTVGFFAAHSVASGWVGRRSAELPGGSPAIGSSLYLLGYYGGSSIGGTVGGVVYDHLGWGGITAYLTVLLAGALALSLLTTREWR
ncbi:MFS transporter [Pseudonocardia ailaonensis]